MELDDEPSLVFFACRICFRLYTLKEDLRGHMIEFHKFVPINSSRYLPEKVKRTEIIQRNHENENGIATKTEPPSNADLRPMPFKNFRLLLRSKLTLRCPITNLCPYKFENPTKLEMHAKCHINAQNRLQFQCFQCGVVMPNWRQCSEHLWKIHQTDVDLLHCPVCITFESHTTVHIWRHMRNHKKWRSLVLRTLRAVQKRRQQKELATRNLTVPVVQNKNKYYAEKTCEICNRKFVNGKTLSKHVKTVHNKIKPFICNICGMKTARKASLTIHMRQHTGEKPLQCKVCKFSTRDPSVLKKHQQRHNKNDLFHCKYCTYACIQTISLKRHIRLKHPEEFKNISCDLCSFVTTNERVLSMHKEDHRRGLIVNADDSMDATRGDLKNCRKLHDKNNEISSDCFMPLESIDSFPHEPTVDTGGVTIPAPPSEDTQFPTYLNN